MKQIFQSVGPAIIVAAVVLGPGSILTSSNVGATVGLLGFPVVVISAVLMISMVALAARLGAVYEDSPCDQLAKRLGRSVAVFIGLVLFAIVAFFQSSNNIALIGGIEPLFGDGTLPFTARCGVLIGVNALIIGSLYLLRNLYGSVERLMKVLMGMMTLSFLFNFVVVWMRPRNYEPVASEAAIDVLPLLGMIGTTFSIGGAFYQAYLVKEKGWGLPEVRRGVTDSIVSISLLGAVTSIILLTAYRVLYQNPDAGPLGSVGDVAKQLEPLFGPSAKIIFCIGILAAALSSFLVNAMIGGTIMSDSIGKGSRLQDGWPVHLTAIALLVGMSVALASLFNQESTIPLITLAQALTVLGNPALAAALIYLGTRRELTGERKVPRWILSLAVIGFCVSCIVAATTAVKVYDKISVPPPAAKTA